MTAVVMVALVIVAVIVVVINGVSRHHIA
jgi:hypothetical protein